MHDSFGIRVYKGWKRRIRIVRSLPFYTYILFIRTFIRADECISCLVESSKVCRECSLALNGSRFCDVSRLRRNPRSYERSSLRPINLTSASFERLLVELRRFLSLLDGYQHNEFIRSFHRALTSVAFVSSFRYFTNTRGYPSVPS